MVRTEVFNDFHPLGTKHSRERPGDWLLLWDLYRELWSTEKMKEFRRVRLRMNQHLSHEALKAKGMEDYAPLLTPTVIDQLLHS